MDLQQAKQEFEQLKERMAAYRYAIALANWDTSTLAPQKGKAPAAKAIGVLSGEAFALKVSPQMRRILEVFEKEEEALSPVTCREAELLREEIAKLEKLPKEEYQEFTELQSVAMFVWEEAKSKNDYGMFAPYLEKIVTFTRRFAALTRPDLAPYDACLDDYEKGVTMRELDGFFAAVREKTVPLVARIGREGREVRTDFTSRHYPQEQQEQLAGRLLELLGFDLEQGVLAASEHPFTTDLNSGDVRLTTHFYEDNPLSSILSVVHEGGHGLYEQQAKRSPIVGGSMLDSGISMGIHESQSRFYENMICRSKGFWRYFFPRLQELWPQQLADVSMEEFYRAINQASPGLIRIEADELTYNLHIMVRYELEKQLIAGEIQVADLPRLWNDRYEEYLGLRPETDSQGVLQDVHWAGGMIGYFPSYALGNAYAAQIQATMGKALDVDALCAKGDLAPIAAWLGENIHQYGMLKTPGQLIKDITGEALNPVYLTQYLTGKFEEIYF